MHAHSDYKIVIRGNEAEKTAIAEILAKAFEGGEFFKLNKDDVIKGRIINVEETYDVVFLEDITNMALEMAKAAIGSEFSIEGVIDTSESAGEYMNFKISYSHGRLEERSSFWYAYPNDGLEDMSYEEYCEEFGFKEDDEDDYEVDYSEDDFEKMKKGWFIVETNKGDVMMATVPLDQIRIIEVE